MYLGVQCAHFVHYAVETAHVLDYIMYDRPVHVVFLCWNFSKMVNYVPNSPYIKIPRQVNVISIQNTHDFAKCILFIRSFYRNRLYRIAYRLVTYTKCFLLKIDQYNDLMKVMFLYYIIIIMIYIISKENILKKLCYFKIRNKKLNVKIDFRYRVSKVK